MTKIEWTDETWNPVIGCSKISAGCENCYAEKMAGRLASMSKKEHWSKVIRGESKLDHYFNVTLGGKWNGETAFVESALEKPLHWKKPRKIFVCSMGDLFHESVPFEWIDKVFAVMALCPQHTFQILTKRPKRMLEYFDERTFGDIITELLQSEADERAWSKRTWKDKFRSRYKIFDTWEKKDGMDEDLPFPAPPVGTIVEIRTIHAPGNPQADPPTTAKPEYWFVWGAIESTFPTKITAETDGVYTMIEQRISTSGGFEDAPDGRSGDAAKEFSSTSGLYSGAAFYVPMHELKDADGELHYRFSRQAILPDGLKYGDMPKWSAVAQKWAIFGVPDKSSIMLNDKVNGPMYLTPVADGTYILKSINGMIDWGEGLLPDGTGRHQVRYWHHDDNPDNREYRLSAAEPGDKTGYTYMIPAEGVPLWKNPPLIHAETHVDCMNSTPAIGKVIVGKDYGAAGKLWNALAAPATPSVLISNNVDGAEFVPPPTAKYQVLTTDEDKLPEWGYLKFAGA